MTRKVLATVSLIVLLVLLPTIGTRCLAQETAHVVQFSAGKTAVVSSGSTVLTMPVPAVFDGGSKQLLLPVVSIAKLLNWSFALDVKSKSCTLTSGNHKISVKVGSKTVSVDGLSADMSAQIENVLGIVMSPVDLLRLMGASVTMSADGRSCTAALPAVPVTSPPVVLGRADPNAVTRLSRNVTYAGRKYTFEIIRIDLKGKGIRIVPLVSAGGMNSGTPYASFVASKPLALINALPFDTTTHIMTGSLGGNGVFPQVKSGFTETLGVDEYGTPFYAEGRLEVRLSLTGAGQTTSMTTYSINGTSWGGFTVYTNWYPKAIWVGGSEQLIVVDRGHVIQRVSGATFQPRLMSAGQYAVHGYQASANHWTMDTIAPLRTAETARLQIMLGDRDLAGGFFIQSAPVVLRAGQPVMGADRYADSFRMTKSGARSFLGIGGGRYMYFIASSTPMSLRTDNVGAALAQLKLFSDVISLDGGGSTTLYYKGSFLFTPGRQLVTCLVVPQ